MNSIAEKLKKSKQQKPVTWQTEPIGSETIGNGAIFIGWIEYRIRPSNASTTIEPDVTSDGRSQFQFPPPSLPPSPSLSLPLSLNK